MKVNIQVASKAKYIPAPASFKRWIKAVLQNKKTDAEVIVRIVDEAESRELNFKYRHKNTPTNVLAFPFDAPPVIDISFLGDIAICAPIVNKEAAEQGKSVEAHWAHLTIHGMLHLLGYDHLKIKDAKKMEARETEILNNLGFLNPY